MTDKIISERFDMFNGVNEADALDSLNVVAAGGAHQIDVHAWDNETTRHAKPQDLLEAFGFKVISWGDTGGHAYAITDNGIYLSSNGYHHHVPAPETTAADLRERGLEFRSI